MLEWQQDDEQFTPDERWNEEEAQEASNTENSEKLTFSFHRGHGMFLHRHHVRNGKTNVSWCARSNWTIKAAAASESFDAFPK